VPDKPQQGDGLTADERIALETFAERRKLADADLSGMTDQERRRHDARQRSVVQRWSMITYKLERRRRIEDVLRAEGMLPPRQPEIEDET
jgi:hypothetical protein